MRPVLLETPYLGGFPRAQQGDTDPAGFKPSQSCIKVMRGLHSMIYMHLLHSMIYMHLQPLLLLCDAHMIG